ncbi:MAG TPA: hypothetical protein GX401_02710 [Clostridiales bacterium]|nr:hypothetical protein [Clostridiales bacterium]
MDNIVTKAKELLTHEKYKKIIIIAGLLGIALIFISSFWGKGNDDNQAAKPQNVTVTSEVTSYKNEVEQSLTNIISSIEGAGQTKILVTVDSSAELVYATDEKNSLNTNNETKDGSPQSDSNTQIENSYITVKLADGTQQTVLLKEIQPKVRGVLVVCSGGDDKVIHQRVLEAVTKALDISSAKVCVTKLSE